LLNSAPPADPDWTDKLEKERQEEIRVIGGACEALGREIHEVSIFRACRMETGPDGRLPQMGIVCLTLSRISYISLASSQHIR
jgi:hypothetical protein